MLTTAGPVPIERLALDDLVLARSDADPYADVVPRPVIHVYKNRAQIFEVALDGHAIATTARHPFWVVDKGWTPASALQPGDQLIGHDGQQTAVRTTRATDRWETVYNFNIAEDHTFFIAYEPGDTSLWVHNNGDCVTYTLHFDDLGNIKNIYNPNTGRMLDEVTDAAEFNKVLAAFNKKYPTGAARLAVVDVDVVAPARIGRVDVDVVAPARIGRGELGDLLGTGGNKQVFAFGDDHAVGLLKPGKNVSLLDEEVALLNQIDELGLPTVNARRITVDGQPALLFDRFAQGSKDVVRLSGGKVRTVGSSSLLNARSAADLRAIRRTMVDNNIKIDDLQFLIGRDGRVVVADPLGVSRAAPSRNNLRMIDLLIQAAER